MTYLKFIKLISGPLAVALFPGSGNLYYNQVRVGYLDFNHASEAQEVNFFRPASIPHLPGVKDGTEEELRDIVKQLTALAVIHSIEIRSIQC